MSLQGVCVCVGEGDARAPAGACLGADEQVDVVMGV